MDIWITTSFVGLHSWKKAPEEVLFLRNQHRHIFKVKVFFSVKHNDREIEFFTIKRKIEKWIDNNIDKQNTGSCEMICQKIYEFNKKDIIRIEVSEDGENGAVLTIDK